MYKNGMIPLSIIVAVDENGGFAKEGKIPWDFPEDMKHFKEVTSGTVCIMGRRTYEDMYHMQQARKTGSPITDTCDEILPGRESFVVTSDVNYVPKGATAVTSIRSVIQSLEENDFREVFVIGGYNMFVEALAWADTIYMTIIKNKQYDCDKFFPIEALKQYRIVDGSQTEDLSFVKYRRFLKQ